MVRFHAEDIVISSMQDIGLYGAQIEDHVPLTAAEKEQMFVDILPDAGADDGSAVLSFFLEETEDGHVLVNDEPMTPEAVKEAILEELAMLRTYSEIGEGTVTIEETEDVDWINNWKQYFHQFWIDDILAIPSWEEPEITDKEPALVFHIDPGTAFGTGMHETTQLCIRQIRKYLTPGTVMLDVGTGSGILAILALMFGIKSAVGTDLDPCAPPAIEDNLRTNGVDPAKFQVILGNLIDDEKVQHPSRRADPADAACSADYEAGRLLYHFRNPGRARGQRRAGDERGRTGSRQHDSPGRVALRDRPQTAGMTGKMA